MALLVSVTANVAAGELSAEARVGERLFSESRFAQFFQQHSGGEINAALPAGDPALDGLAVASTGPSVIKGAHAGQSMSCASCHLGEEYSGQVGLPAKGNNLFGDFSARSPLSVRNDDRQVTVRNAPPLVGAGAGLASGWGLLHWDGEFTSMEDLFVGTATGRNFGWLPEEHAEARRHFVRVIREDNGQSSLAGKYAQLSYAVLLRGTDVSIPASLRLPESFRFNPATATEDEVLRGCARLVSAYIASLQFSRERSGAFAGSPYDAFLAANRLPRAPDPGEVPHAYARRLHAAVAALRSPKFIDDPARKFQLHEQDFRFGELELRGLRIFFRGTLGYGRAASAGNCAECHVPPQFTDFSFHNTGVAQHEYDALHGLGTFARLAVPDAAARAADYDRWLAPTPQHPKARGVFLSKPSSALPGQTDLGLWNIYHNPDFPAPQISIERMLNREGRLDPDAVLALTMGRFKTPTVRDLGQSAPYLHTGHQRTVEEVIQFYREMSDLARTGKVRNAPSEYSNMQLEESDIAPLTAFLRSLNEDYQGAK